MHLPRKRIPAAFVILCERLTMVLWRIVSWGLLFAGFWFLQIPAIFGPYGEGFFTLVFGGGTVWLIRRDFSAFHWPRKHEIDRRLEQDSALQHRPLSTWDDELSNPVKPETRTLWQKNKKTAAESIKKLRLPRPRPVLTERDPGALRLIVVLLLVTGITVAGAGWQERLQHGLFPFHIVKPGPETDKITLRITPPAYTGREKITLHDTGKQDDILDIPAGSLLKVQVHGGFGRPFLIMDDTEIPLENTGNKNWHVEIPVTDTDTVTGTHRIEIRQFHLTKISLSYRYVKDTPPIITLKSAPETLPKGALQIPLTVKDDYGVAGLTLRMTLDPSVEEAPLGTPVEDTRTIMMTPADAELDITPVYDLSWHPWAGLPVILTMTVKDHTGQSGNLPPLHMTLPQRPFYNPVAKELIAMRKRLAWTPLSAGPNVSRQLERLLFRPDLFRQDVTVFLSLRSASSRLRLSPTTESARFVISQLWDTALHIEDGNLPLASRTLNQARQNLEQLLDNPDSTSEDIAAAMDDLRQAMSTYFQELFREMQKRRKGQENTPQMSPGMPGMFANNINPEDMEAFLDALQAEALSGNRNAAQELLGQLRQFTNRLNTAVNAEMPPEMAFMFSAIQDLQNLIEKQKELHDQTLKQAKQMAAGIVPPQYAETLPFEKGALDEWGAMPPPPQENKAEKHDAPKINTQQHKGEQDALRYVLGQLMLVADEEMGAIPQNWQDAEQEMRLSAERLATNRPDQSVLHQEKTIEYLTQSQEEMSKQLTAMMQQMTLLSFGMGRTDPLGRPLSEGNGPSLLPGGTVKIPDEASRNRVKSILNLLRRRTGQRNRPDYELDYYRRLMKRF